MSPDMLSPKPISWDITFADVDIPRYPSHPKVMSQDIHHTPHRYPRTSIAGVVDIPGYPYHLKLMSEDIHLYRFGISKDIAEDHFDTKRYPVCSKNIQNDIHLC
jgi:hypothetical protein